MTKPFFDPVRNTTNKPQYEATLYAGTPGAQDGALTVKSAKREGKEISAFEIFWHPTQEYRVVASGDISNVRHIKTKRQIKSLAGYYR
ncbi:hypothetical protein [Rhizobium cremeum]|uniref:hypothetical protein n=1 Tax=Rhizobium cremeum TaxID=2813827 RepID=UPI0039E01A14